MNQIEDETLRKAIKNSIVSNNESKRILGFYVNNKMQLTNENWEKTLNAIHYNVKQWRNLNIPLETKAKLVNAQILSGLYFKAQISFVPDEIITQVNKIIFRTLLQHNHAHSIVNYKTTAAPLAMGGIINKGIGLCQHNTNARLAKVALEYYKNQRNTREIDEWTWQLARFEFFDKTHANPTILNGFEREIAIKYNNPRIHQMAALAMAKLHIRKQKTMHYDEFINQTLLGNATSLGLWTNKHERGAHLAHTIQHLVTTSISKQSAMEQTFLQNLKPKFKNLSLIHI